MDDSKPTAQHDNVTNAANADVKDAKETSITGSRAPETGREENKERAMKGHDRNPVDDKASASARERGVKREREAQESASEKIKSTKDRNQKDREREQEKQRDRERATNDRLASRSRSCGSSPARKAAKKAETSRKPDPGDSGKKVGSTSSRSNSLSTTTAVTASTATTTTSNKTTGAASNKTVKKDDSKKTQASAPEKDKGNPAPKTTSKEIKGTPTAPSRNNGTSTSQKSKANGAAATPSPSSLAKPANKLKHVLEVLQTVEREERPATRSIDRKATEEKAKCINERALALKRLADAVKVSEN